MNIKVIYSAEISDERVKKIQKHLESEKGPIRFGFERMSGEPFDTSTYLSFDELFSVSASYREQHHVPEKDFVYTLTDIANDRNFFASLQPSDIRNGFVHAGDWERIIDCDSSLPVAFTLLNLAMLGSTIGRYDEIRKVVHEDAIGCLNDFCGNKREVIFKLRTGDICANCIDSMVAKGLSILKIDQALRMLDRMREEMKFSSRYSHDNFKPSRIKVDIDARCIEFIDYENVRVVLTELQMALYLLFLLHPEGIPLRLLSDHWEQLKVLYMRVANRNEDYFEAELKGGLKNVVRIVGGTGSWNLTKIKDAIIKAIGKNFCPPYIIQGANGENKGISLPREIVVNHDELEQLKIDPK